MSKKAGKMDPLVVYKILYNHFGPQHWWPGRTRFEVMVGAILTQRTSWTNVEKAILQLRQEGVLTPEGLGATPLRTLASWIRPAVYYNQKARRLKALADLILTRYGGRMGRMVTDPDLRQVLLGVNGIGPETADCMMLYAAKRPHFVIDTYTRRMLTRHGWASNRADYETLASLFTRDLPSDAGLFNEFHALLVALGKAYCGSTPRCETCPLRSFLPREGVPKQIGS